MLIKSHTAALTVHQVSKSYNLKPVLKDVTFSVNPGECLGLIGPNGAGKSTLLRILAGELAPDQGHVALAPANLRVGYLSQSFTLEPTLTFQEAVDRAAGTPVALEQRLVELAAALAIDPDSISLQAAYDETLQQMSRTTPGEIGAILAGTGLEAIPPEQKVGTLSGGQKTRLALALLLLIGPELLVLDEPTNHLDIEMVEWLERWLLDFTGGILLVSHDRALLDNVCTSILDLDPDTHTIRQYSGNYSDYLDQFLRAQEKQWSNWRDEQYEIRRMRQDINRTKEQAQWVERTTTPGQPGVRRYAKKVAKKAKSREKKLERYLTDDDRVEKPKQHWQMKLAFENGNYIGRDVLRLEDLTVGYPGQLPLLTGLNLDIQAGQRVVLTGPNGSGKTTLVRVITGAMQPQAGRVSLGGSVKLGYMSQEQTGLDPNLSALETIQSSAPLNETDARSFLHFFLFSGDDSLRPISRLSFGERARLALARLVVHGCTFLVLDEPINHLDIPSRSRFEQALQQFHGTVLAVVHDRYFIERFATDLWLVKEGGIEQRIVRED
jgi:ATP-binding cassette subfamily F protein 3